MSSVLEVTSISIDGEAPVSLSAAIDTVTITDAMSVPSVTLDVPNETEMVMIEVPGIQGVPGLQNVYVQLNDPSVEFGWGMEQKGYIWIEVDV